MTAIVNLPVFSASESINDCIRRERLRRGWTQLELATRAGLHEVAIQRLERPGYKTSVTTLERLAEAFETTLVIGFVPTQQR